MDKKIKRYRITDDGSKFMNRRVRLLKRYKKECLNEIFNCTHYPNNNPLWYLNFLKSTFRNIKTLLKQAFSSSQNKYWEHKFSEINTSDPKSMFSIINRISDRANPRKQMPSLSLPMTEYASIVNSTGILKENIAIDTTDNTFAAIHPQDNLTVLGSILERVHCQNDDLGYKFYNDKVRNRMSELPVISELAPLLFFSQIQRADNVKDEKFTSIHEIRTILKNTNTKISSGTDNIPNIVIKHLPICLAREYCTLFNNMINNSHFPVGWKTAKVFPILKKNKDPAKPSSYRPISLLPNMSKVFEKVMQSRIVCFTDEHNIIPDTQFGFRRGHSTVHAISKLVSDVCWQKNNRNGVGACLIDTEKAFDTVWLDGLIFKLTECAFPGWIVSMLRQMLYDKKFLISDFERETEPRFLIRNGLQQGTVLAPILYSIFTHDLFSLNIFARYGNGIIGYADDIIVYTAGDNIDRINKNMDVMIRHIETYFVRWRLRINPNKCEAILFRTPLREGPSHFVRNWKRFAVAIYGTPLPSADAVRYLGIHIDNKFNFNKHASNQLIKAKKVIHALSRIFFSRYISHKVKLICYLSLIRPVLTYGCPIWFSIDPSTMEDLRRLERRCLRYCLYTSSRSPDSNYVRYVKNGQVYRDSEIPRIDNHMIALTRNHCARSSETLENPLISHPLLSLSGGYVRKCMNSGILPPEAFIYLDAKGYIQDRNGIPVFYHIIRDYPKRRIAHEPCCDILAAPANLPVAFNVDIPSNDVLDSFAASTSYWWKQDGDGFG